MANEKSLTNATATVDRGIGRVTRNLRKTSVRAKRGGGGAIILFVYAPIISVVYSIQVPRSVFYSEIGEHLYVYRYYTFKNIQVGNNCYREPFQSTSTGQWRARLFFFGPILFSNDYKIKTSATASASGECTCMGMGMGMSMDSVAVCAYRPS